MPARVHAVVGGGALHSHIHVLWGRGITLTCPCSAGVVIQCSSQRDGCLHEYMVLQGVEGSIYMLCGPVARDSPGMQHAVPSGGLEVGQPCGRA